ncbi:MAG: septum site-determining protein MinC [Microcystaceae cyanobacterium]
MSSTMTFDFSPQNSLPNYSQVHLASEDGQIQLILPTNTNFDNEGEWQQFHQDLKTALHQSELSWDKGQAVHLMSQDRLLDGRQLQNLAEILEEAHLTLQWVHTSRRQTAVAAVSAGYSVQQQTDLPVLEETESFTPPLLANPLYVKSTVRSGIKIDHPGTVIVAGDVNPGGDVIATGDIIIWGTLRGVAHAGAKGNGQCCIMALRMEPTQLRIADRVARAPTVEPNHWEPEIAHLSSDGIRLTSAYNFWKTHLFDEKKQEWQEKI